MFQLVWSRHLTGHPLTIFQCNSMTMDSFISAFDHLTGKELLEAHSGILRSAPLQHSSANCANVWSKPNSGGQSYVSRDRASYMRLSAGDHDSQCFVLASFHVSECGSGIRLSCPGTHIRMLRGMLFSQLDSLIQQ